MFCDFFGQSIHEILNFRFEIVHRLCKYRISFCKDAPRGDEDQQVGLGMIYSFYFTVDTSNIDHKQ